MICINEVLHYEVEPSGCLEGVLQLNDEGMLTGLEYLIKGSGAIPYIALQYCILLEFMLNDLLLSNLLHRVDFIVISLLHLVHLAKRTLSHYLKKLVTLPNVPNMMKSSRPTAYFFDGGVTYETSDFSIGGGCTTKCSIDLSTFHGGFALLHFLPLFSGSTCLINHFRGF